MAAGCAMPTSMHAIERADIALGDAVVIQGAGPVGLCCALLAKMSGAAHVMVIDSHRNRLERAAALAADSTLSLNAAEPSGIVTVVRDRLAGRGADVTIEATGSPKAVPDGMRMTRDGGRYVIVGHYTDGGEVAINPHWDINRRHLEVRGCWGSDFSHFYRMIRLLERLDERTRAAFDALITHEFGLHDMNHALAVVERGEAVKALVDPWR
jgi:L-iditol 2-dehydrogenase